MYLTFEDKTQDAMGRIDLTLQMQDKAIIIEFKVDSHEQNSLQQIKERNIIDYAVEGI